MVKIGKALPWYLSGHYKLVAVSAWQRNNLQVCLMRAINSAFSNDINCPMPGTNDVSSERGFLTFCLHRILNTYADTAGNMSHSKEAKSLGINWSQLLYAFIFNTEHGALLFCGIC